MKLAKFTTMLSLVVACSQQVSGAVLNSHSYDLSALNVFYSVAGADLINAGQPSLASVTSDYTSYPGYQPVGALNDGGSSSNVLPANLSGFSVTYNLNTAISPLGYRLSRIVTTAGSGDARARQEFKVFYSLANSPGNFVQIIPGPSGYTPDRVAPFQTNNSTAPGDLGGGTGGETRVTIDVSGLSGVAAIRFETEIPSGNAASGATNYREFDVFGSSPLRVYEGENLPHIVGRAESGAWSCNAAQDSPGFLQYGPYDNTLPTGRKLAAFVLKIDNNVADNFDVAVIDVYDATSGISVARSTISRNRFLSAGTFQDFELPFDVTAPGHSYEFRVYWLGYAKVSSDRVIIYEDPNLVGVVDGSREVATPSAVRTVYATEDVVVADFVATNRAFGADRTGVLDSTNAIQNALNACYNAGGGTVFLPAGTYRVTNTIQVPSFVTLRGDWRDPDIGSGSYGTVIRAEVASGDNGPSLFKIGGSAGVVGVTTFYPNQNAVAPVPYNYTFLIPSRSWAGMPGTYMSSSVINCTMLNSYRGIGINALDISQVHETSTVRNVKGTVLYRGAVAFNGADVGTWEHVTFGNSYWASAGPSYNAPSLSTLNTWTRANGVGLTLGDLEWEQFFAINCYDYKYGIQIVAGARQRFSGIFSWANLQNTDVALKMDDVDSRWGVSLIRSVLYGGAKSVQNGTGGYAHICDSLTAGTTSGNVSVTGANIAPASYPEASYPRIPRTFLVDATKAPYFAPHNLPHTGLPSSDATAAIQAALNDIANAGGGVVYLPAGWYRINSHLSVPANTELRGSSSVPTRDQTDSSMGTVILGYGGDNTPDPDTATALITLNGDNSGISGTRFFYPNNNPANIVKPYPFTVRGRGSSIFAVNLGLTGVWNGIDFSTYRCDGHLIRKVVGVAYRKFIAVGPSTHGWIEGCLSNPVSVCRSNFGIPGWTTETNIFAQVIDPVTRPNQTLITIAGSADERLRNNFAYGCYNGIRISSGSANVFNFGTDNLGNPGYGIWSNGGNIKVMNFMRYNGTDSFGPVTILNRMNL